MSRVRVPSSTLFLALLIPVGAQAAPPVEPTITQLIVRFKPAAGPLAPAMHGDARAATPARMEAVAQAAGLALHYGRAMTHRAHVLRLPRAMSATEAAEAARRISGMSDVEYAEPDIRLHPAMEPDDTRYPNQWHYHDPAGGDAGAANLPGAWDLAHGDGITVAVVDTGVLNHADLQANLIGGSAAAAGYDMVSTTSTGGGYGSNDGDGRDSDPTDPGDYYSAYGSNSSWHGTHVAGTIAAVSQNANGVSGVAWNSRILAVRVLGAGGGDLSDVAEGIVWAAGGAVPGAPANAHPAQVINLSLGAYGACGPTMQDAIDTAIANGATVVVAAGNSRSDAANFMPASCSGVVTVAAVARNGLRAFYSNYDGSGSYIAVAAPGGDMTAAASNGILSTLDGGVTTARNDNVYRRYQGTSMATPHVAGIVALMLSANSHLTDGAIPKNEVPALIRDKLRASARPFPATRDRTHDCADSMKCGAGIVDAAAAVRAVSTAPVVSAGADSIVTPATPVTLSGSISDDGTFSHQWTQTSGGAVTLQNAATLNPGFTAPAAADTLTFRLTATDDVKLTGSDTVTVRVRTPVAAPASLTAMAVSAGRIDLHWGIGGNEEEFRIFRAADGGAPILLATAGTGTTSYSDTGLTPAMGYSYYVIAYNGFTSPPSNTASTTAPGSGGSGAAEWPLLLGAAALAWRRRSHSPL